ncbi:hypothetical protein AX16_007999 [Volvariella volvacea WC 439]|nr:hypothetical protein AX16_007999 [Volvariella volvacea WC 439]
MPLAGKPPYATDEPDSYYESSPAPQRRVRQPAPEDPNKRTSAYDMYDNYLSSNATNNPDANRQSGVGALGMGLLNGSMDDDSDDDDEPARKPATANSTPASSQPVSKHAALAAATGATSPQSSSPSVPQPIAAPRPGYAAPIAALNLARPEPIAVPQGRQQQLPPLENPFEDNASFTPAPPSPMSSAPHPLQPPMTPITPVFARPAKPASAPGVKFSDPIPRSKPIMRGNTEETLLPKRGEKGDDFWRRFSMIAKEPTANKESSWLRKTRDGSNRLSRWVWVVGLLLLIAAAGGIGLGWYISHNSPDHQPPTALGGSANEAAPVESSTPVVNQQTRTSFHVTPTHTIDARALKPRSTPVSQVHNARRQPHSTHKKRRIQWGPLP